MLKIIDEFRWQRKTEENQHNPLNIPENETYDKNAGPTPRRDMQNPQNTWWLGAWKP